MRQQVFDFPEFDLGQFARNQYYNNLTEREAFGIELISYEEYYTQNEEWLLEEYERLLSQ
jgi:hypothetical protein